MVGRIGGQEATALTAVIVLPRPVAGEFDPAADEYVSLAPAIDDAVLQLTRQRDAVMTRVSPLTEDQASFRYAPGKWTVGEVLGHMCDAERIFAYRLLRIGRGDETPLSGFDENTYVPAGAFERRPLADLIDEWATVRNATLALVRGMPGDAWARRGVANGRGVTAAALVYIVVGHVEHHMKILDVRYGLRP